MANYDETMEEIEKEAKKRLQGIISENQLGYQGLLKQKIKEICLEKGIEWNPEIDNVSID